MSAVGPKPLKGDDSVALRDLADRYADAIDRRDEDALRKLFGESGVLRVQPDDGPPGSEWTGPEVVKAIDGVRSYSNTLHHVGTCVFEPDGDDGATGRVGCLAHHYERTGSGPVDLVMMIVYHDRYTRGPDGWRFADRRVAIQWTELHPALPRRRPRT